MKFYPDIATQVKLLNFSIKLLQFSLFANLSWSLERKWREGLIIMSYSLVSFVQMEGELPN